MKKVSESGKIDYCSVFVDVNLDLDIEQQCSSYLKLIGAFDNRKKTKFRVRKLLF